MIMQQADPFADVQIPPELEQSLQRHREHLVQLVTTMRSAGINEAQIDESVSVIVASYKEELLRAVKRMMN